MSQDRLLGMLTLGIRDIEFPLMDLSSNLEWKKSLNCKSNIMINKMSNFEEVKVILSVLMLCVDA